MSDYRQEKDSMGEVKVPKNAYYAAQTQRAIDNFPISGIRFGRPFIKALGIIKYAAAESNLKLKLLSPDICELIKKVSMEIIEGKLDHDFPIDIFQTGSGTSTNMNANEVVANRANELAREQKIDCLIHPNDHVNYGQSSNDVIPTAIRIAAVTTSKEHLIPKMKHLQETFLKRGKENAHIVKTGRTHLMDAMPVSFEQVFSGYARQIELGIDRIESALTRLLELPQGGTAVGTGINTHKEFGNLFAQIVKKLTGHQFIEAVNHFEAQSTVDAPAELSSQIKTFAASLMKVANDFRWSNSGPNAGLGDIQLKALQPGSSIMPGKVNPVIEESTIMSCAHIMGNDLAVTIGASWGNFELNVMLPLVAHNLLESINIMGNVCNNFADRSIAVLQINTEEIRSKIDKNPILVTALNPIIGYELGAKIAKTAFKEKRALKEVAKEMCSLSEEELDKALDPNKMI